MHGGNSVGNAMHKWTHIHSISSRHVHICVGVRDPIGGSFVKIYKDFYMNLFYMNLFVLISRNIIQLYASVEGKRLHLNNYSTNTDS